MTTLLHPRRATAYDDDFHAWCEEQAALIEAGRFAEVDRANVAEELRDLGSEKYDALEGAYRVLLMHMLKWDHQPELRSRSWAISIRTQRRAVAKLLAKNPSLKSKRAEAIAEAYEDARDDAAKETNLRLPVFPRSCAYTESDILQRSFALDGDEE